MRASVRHHAGKIQGPAQPFLKNVSLVVYEVFPAADKRLCTIDLEAWRTAIDFVANQSTKLKLMREREHYERTKELVNKANEAGRKYITRSASTQKWPQQKGRGTTQ